jgi:DNA-binding transcriptional MerR regulator
VYDVLVMLIGQLADRAGVTPQTIRYYESLGLLQAAERTAGGYRRYATRAIEELLFVRRAQALGFSLDHIKHILALARSGKAPCSRVLEIAESQLAEVEERLVQLNQLRETLSEAIRRWKKGSPSVKCATTLCGLVSDAAKVRELDGGYNALRTLAPRGRTRQTRELTTTSTPSRRPTRSAR